MKVVVALAAAAVLTLPPSSIAAPPAVPPVFQSAPASIVGLWKLIAGDASSTQVVTLQLRANGTYTKTLNANVGGSRYDGTHVGSWTAEGMVVHLSGSSDSQWPPYTHDLRKFRRLR